MEGGLTKDSDFEADMSKVYDVKPLSCFIPIFPNSPQSPLFPNFESLSRLMAGLFGTPSPFTLPDLNGHGQPAEVANGGTQNRFFPFGSPDGTTPAVPIMPCRASGVKSAAVNHFNGASNGHAARCMVGGSSSAQASVKRQKTAAQGSHKAVAGLAPSKQANGSSEIVQYVSIMYDAVRRRLCQIEEAKGITKRPDLKAGNILMTQGIRTNMNKRIGAVPGVEVGDIFFYRMELCLVGIHTPSMAGIDYITGKTSSELAVSIVSSGGYDDEVEDKNILIYTGQGGISQKKVVHQKLEKGNLALENSLGRANDVRVIRGMKDPMNPITKFYIYDGLYSVMESWTEKGRTGGNIFKFKLVRLANQPSAFAVWQSVEMWKQSISSRAGLLLHDVASGAENTAVVLVNEIDNDKGPSYFTYHPSLKYSKPYISTRVSLSCNCPTCTPGVRNCSCVHKNGGDFPYFGTGILASRRPMLYECGIGCPCHSNCKNRVSQTGLKFHFEVFKTADRGWGLRSWDPIRAGAFICEYAGEVIDKQKSENDDYIFDTSQHNHDSLKWNYEPALLDEEWSAEPTEEYNIPVPLIISAKNIGNVARFMNHSCSPNVFWQPVMYEDNNEPVLHIAVFAIKNIPPMTELTFDYGISQSARKKKCFCKTAKCRGYFG